MIFLISFLVSMFILLAFNKHISNALITYIKSRKKNKEEIKEITPQDAEFIKDVDRWISESKDPKEVEILEELKREILSSNRKKSVSIKTRSTIKGISIASEPNQSKSKRRKLTKKEMAIIGLAGVAVFIIYNQLKRRR